LFSKSRTTLFLIEKLIVIVVFALCAAACVEIFTEAFLMASDSRNMNYALVAAKNGAERLKANGDMSGTAEALGGRHNDSGLESVIVYYDGDWQASSEAGAAFVMRLSRIEGEPPHLCRLSVEKIGGEEILSFTAAARSVILP